MTNTHTADPTTPNWSVGDYMQTYTGRRFYPLAPLPEQIDPEDIAHALSMTCRYGGHSVRFYSVAEHCVILSKAVAPEHALWALLHDAAEAYVGDMVRPLKRFMPEFSKVEDEILDCILERFGLGSATEMPAEVLGADTRILLDERAAIMRPTEDVWLGGQLEPLGVQVTGWPPPFAKRAYLARLAELTGSGAGR